ncbi:hypothetical protein LTR62_001493 [Meristemomyces frigidus]|uniref:Nudix hydrolase domain-containing protein n=1 Tax=Meristemomyces frigidus TaxID=1508187 RepID=A0AAN7YI77_9PEZI|nr:hypothetical protein LTR62_001493 [Meristemomyces frigidus]
MAAPPRVGVGVFVFDSARGGNFLTGKRKGSHGAGTWALPGGHLEHGESFEECGSREIEEETGLTLSRIQYLTTTNSVFEDTGKHYVTVFMIALTYPGADGEPQEARVSYDNL